jgi:hypothetical protein
MKNGIYSELGEENERNILDLGINGMKKSYEILSQLKTYGRKVYDIQIRNIHIYINT